MIAASKLQYSKKILCNAMVKIRLIQVALRCTLQPVIFAVRRSGSVWGFNALVLALAV